MENRVVALSVLEDLMHWPLAPRDGSAPRNVSSFYATGSYGGKSAMSNGTGGCRSGRGGGSDTRSRAESTGDENDGGDDDDDDDDDETCFVAGSVAGDQHLEPRAHRQARYRAVLMLPHLCHKLGHRWVALEVVPYLIRCAQEEDAQLSFAVGIALLGLLLPLPEGSVKRAPSSSSAPAVTADGVACAFSSYLSVEDVAPVVELLAASRDACTRAFVAQVVIPHLLFGVSVEREVLSWPQGWEAKYIPARVWAEEAALRSGGGNRNSSSSKWDGEDTDDFSDTDDDWEYEIHAEGYYECIIQQQQQQRERAIASNGKTGTSTAAAKPLASLPPPAPRFIDPLSLREDISHLFDEECTNISLLSRRDALLARCGLREAGVSSALASATDRRARAVLARRMYAAFSGERGGGGDARILRGAPLALHGAAYAGDMLGAGGGGNNSRNSNSSGGKCTGSISPDYFGLNARARTLVEETATWMDTLGAAPAVPPAASVSGASSTSKGSKENKSRLARGTSSLSFPRKGMLALADYICDAAADTSISNSGTRIRQAALRARWKVGQQLLQGLLGSPHPGAVAVAVESISMFLHAISVTLSGIDADALPIPPTTPSSSLVVVAKPHTPLRTEAELQAFQYYTTRRHVAYCLAAVTPTTTRTATVTETPVSDGTAESAKHALLNARSELLDLLLGSNSAGGAGAGVLTALNLADSTLRTPPSALPKLATNPAFPQIQLQFGPGPREVRSAGLASWDVCFSACTAISPADRSRPVDAAHFLLAPASAGDEDTSSPSPSPSAMRTGASMERKGLLYAAQNMSSAFRLHRVVRAAVLSALPLTLDMSSLQVSDATDSAGRNASHTLSLGAICRLLLEALAPPSMLPGILRDWAAGATTTGDGNSNAMDSSTPSARTSPSMRVSSFSPAGTEESPASLDYTVAEAAITAAHRLMAEVAVAIPSLVARAYGVNQSATTSPLAAASSGAATRTTAMTAIAWRRADKAVAGAAERVLRPLSTLLCVMARVVATYASWRSRWLLMKRLPGLVACYCLIVQRFAQSGVTAAGMVAVTGGPANSSLATVVIPFYDQVVVLLTSLWSSNPGNEKSHGGPSSPQKTGTSAEAPSTHAPATAAAATAATTGLLVLLAEEEETEVRCVAVPCAALLFDVVAQAAIRIAAVQAQQRQASRGSTTASSGDRTEAAALTVALGLLLPPLLPLLKGIVTVSSDARADRQPRVRCAAASALSSVSRTLSALSVLAASVYSDGTDPSARDQDLLPATVREEAWRNELATVTDALVSLMSDASSAVQLTLVSELADLLVSAPASPSTSLIDVNADDGSSVKSPTSRGNTEEAGRSRAGSEDPARVRHAALLSCLESLAKHEVWRFRERYAILLCRMCTKFLTPRHTHISHTRCRGSTGNGASSSEVSGARHNYRLSPSPQVGEEDTTTGWSHNHPLFRLARQELLPMLVAVLFDKVKAVRDTALKSTEQLCGRLNAVALATNSTMAGYSGSSGGGNGQAFSDAGSLAREGSSAGRGGVAGSGGNLGDTVSGSSNRFVNDVLWPLIRDYPKAWETYLSRSALLRVAVGLRADKESVLLPLLDQLAHDAVLNVRLVVAKEIHHILRQSGSGGGGITPAAVGSPTVVNGAASSPSAMSPTAAVRRGGLAGRRTGGMGTTGGGGGGSDSGSGGGDGGGGDYAANDGAALPPVEFTEEEKNGVVLSLLRQLLEDASADVRSEAAQALKVCF